VSDSSQPTADINSGLSTAVGHRYSDLIGTTIDGRYKVRGLLGEGGFGVVYEAEQVEPVRRRVAVKVIKPGMDSKSVLARFEAERQALAVMDHPNIARVLDGGVTDRGLPYFVMDLVRGEAITEFCDLHKLTLRERVELFRTVCTAVQHAHTKGVIHRDIKPSNILVEYANGAPTPKIIDFGIAKAIDQRLSEQTIFTERGQLIGTPEYMSPEQAEMSGLDIDTRTDVYSLGAVLYELLTGFTPFDSASLRRAGFNEIQRIIREMEPPRPSTRISTHGGTGVSREQVAKAASARSLRDAELSASLRRDLDWIVLKCLDKNRERRYGTPLGLEEDLGHYLNDEPVTARTPSVLYKCRKFARRNRALIATASAFVLVVVVGLVTISVLLVRSMAAEREASRRLSEARSHAGVIADEVGRSWSRGNAAQSADSVETLWAWCQAVLADDDPFVVDVGQRATLALGYAGRGDRMLEVAKETVKRSQSIDDPILQVWALDHYHWAERVQGVESESQAKRAEHQLRAVAAAERTLAESERLLAVDDWRSVLFGMHLAYTLHLFERKDEALAVLNRWRSRVDEVSMPSHFRCRAHGIAAVVLASVGQFDEAESHIQSALSFIPDRVPLVHVEAQWTLSRAVDVYELWGDSGGGQELVRVAEKLRAQIVYPQPY